MTPKKRISEMSDEELEERLPTDWYGLESLFVETVACDEYEEYGDDPNV